MIGKTRLVRGKHRRTCDLCTHSVPAVMQITTEGGVTMLLCISCLRKALNVIEGPRLLEGGMKDEESATSLLLSHNGGKLLLSIAETCEQIGMALQTGYNLAAAGQFPIAGSKRLGKWAFDVRDVGTYLDDERERSRIEKKHLDEKMRQR